MAAPSVKSVTVEAAEWHPLRPRRAVRLGAGDVISVPEWLPTYRWTFQADDDEQEVILQQDAAFLQLDDDDDEPRGRYNQAAFVYTIERPTKSNEGIYRVYQQRTRAGSDDRDQWGLRLRIEFTVTPLYRVFYAHHGQSLTLPLVLNKRHSQARVRWLYYGLLTRQQTRYGLAEWTRDMHAFYDNRAHDMWDSHASLIKEVPPLHNREARRRMSLAILREFIQAPRITGMDYMARTLDDIEERLARYFDRLTPDIITELKRRSVKLASTEGGQMVAYLRSTNLLTPSEVIANARLDKSGDVPSRQTVKAIYTQHVAAMKETRELLAAALDAIVNDIAVRWLNADGVKLLRRDSLTQKRVVTVNATAVPDSLNTWLYGQQEIWDDDGELRVAILEQADAQTVLKNALKRQMNQELIVWLRALPATTAYSFAETSLTNVFTYGAISDIAERLGFTQTYSLAVHSETGASASGFQMAQLFLDERPATSMYSSWRAMHFYLFYKQPRDWRAMQRVLEAAGATDLVMPYYYSQPVIVSRMASRYEIPSIDAHKHAGLYVQRQLATDGSRWVDVAHIHVLVPRHEERVRVRAFRSDAANQIHLDANMPSASFSGPSSDAYGVLWFKSTSLSLPEFVDDDNGAMAATHNITRRTNTPRWQLYPTSSLDIRMAIVLKDGVKPDQGYYGVFARQRDPIDNVLRIAYLAVYHVQVDGAYDTLARMRLGSSMRLQLHAALPVIRSYYSATESLSPTSIKWRMTRADRGTQKLPDTGAELYRASLSELDQGRYEALITLRDNVVDPTSLVTLQVTFAVTLHTADKRTGTLFDVEAHQFGETHWHSQAPEDPLLHRRPRKAKDSVRVRPLTVLLKLVKGESTTRTQQAPSFARRLELLLGGSSSGNTATAVEISADEKQYVVELQQRLQHLATIARRVDYKLPARRASSPSLMIDMLDDDYSKWIASARMNDLHPRAFLTLYNKQLCQRDIDMLMGFFDVPDWLYDAHAGIRGTPESQMPTPVTYDTGRIDVAPLYPVRGNPIRDYGFRRELLTVHMGRAIYEYVARDSGRTSDEQGAWSGYYSARTRDPVPYNWTYGFRVHSGMTVDDVVQAFLASGRRGSVHMDTHHVHEREHEMIQLQKELIAREFAQLWQALQEAGRRRVSITVLARFLEGATRVEQAMTAPAAVRRNGSNDNLFGPLLLSSGDAPLEIGDEATTGGSEAPLLPAAMVERVLRRLQRIIELQEAYNGDINEQRREPTKLVRRDVLRFLGIDTRRVREDAIEAERYTKPERFVAEHPDAKGLTANEQLQLVRALKHIGQLKRRGEAEIGMANRRMASAGMDIDTQNAQWEASYPYAYRVNHPNKVSINAKLAEWRAEMDDRRKHIERFQRALKTLTDEKDEKKLMDVQYREKLEALIDAFPGKVKTEFLQAESYTRSTASMLKEEHERVAPLLTRYSALLQRIDTLTASDMRQLAQFDKERVKPLNPLLRAAFPVDDAFARILKELPVTVREQHDALSALLTLLTNEMGAAMANQRESYATLKADIDGWKLNHESDSSMLTLDALDNKLNGLNRRTGNLITDTLNVNVTKANEMLNTLARSLQEQRPLIRKLLKVDLEEHQPRYTQLNDALKSNLPEQLNGARAAIVTAVSDARKTLTAENGSLGDEVAEQYMLKLTGIADEQTSAIAGFLAEVKTQEARLDALDVVKRTLTVATMMIAYTDLRTNLLAIWLEEAGDLRSRIGEFETTLVTRLRALNRTMRETADEKKRKQKQPRVDTSENQRRVNQEKYNEARKEAVKEATDLQSNHINVLVTTGERVSALKTTVNADMNLMFLPAVRERIQGTYDALVTGLSDMVTDLQGHKVELDKIGQDTIGQDTLDGFDMSAADFNASIKRTFLEPLKMEREKITATLQKMYARDNGGFSGALQRLVTQYVKPGLVDSYYAQFTVANANGSGGYQASARSFQAGAPADPQALLARLGADLETLTAGAQTNRLEYSPVSRVMKRVAFDPGQEAQEAWAEIKSIAKSAADGTFMQTFRKNLLDGLGKGVQLYTALQDAVATLQGSMSTLAEQVRPQVKGKEKKPLAAASSLAEISNQWKLVVASLVANQEWIINSAQPHQWDVGIGVKMAVYEPLRTIDAKHSAGQWAWQTVDVLNTTTDSMVQRYLNIEAGDGTLDRQLRAMLRAYAADNLVANDKMPLFVSTVQNAPRTVTTKGDDAQTLNAANNVRVLLKGQLPLVSATDDATLGMSLIDMSWSYITLNHPRGTMKDVELLERVLAGRVRFLLWDRESDALTLWQRAGGSSATWQHDGKIQVESAEIMLKFVVNAMTTTSNVSLVMEANLYDQLIMQNLQGSPGDRNARLGAINAQITRLDDNVFNNDKFTTFATRWQTGLKKLKDRVNALWRDAPPEAVTAALTRYSAIPVSLERHIDMLKGINGASDAVLWFEIDNRQRDLCLLFSGLYALNVALSAKGKQIDSEMHEIDKLLIVEEEDKKRITAIQHSQEALVKMNAQVVPNRFSDKALLAEEARLSAQLKAFMPKDAVNN